MTGMLESLITSKTRIKLLLKFFLNSSTTAHLRGLESEFGESTNGIRLELNRFEQAGLLKSHAEGNRKIYQANCRHPLFFDIQHIVHKHIGLDQLIDQVISHIGQLDKVFLTGSFAKGMESNEIELLIIGNQVDVSYIEKLATKTAKLINRKINFRLLNQENFEDSISIQEKKQLLLLWQGEQDYKSVRLQ